jgi:hypothetical protein
MPVALGQRGRLWMLEKVYELLLQPQQVQLRLVEVQRWI